ncbi:hypothetical protein THIOKS12580034 [Thiocapsa sp. KS1]|nr:hypothetical protein THIOKS12580034 [Thiocapsa sp. KS1]
MSVRPSGRVGVMRSRCLLTHRRRKAGGAARDERLVSKLLAVAQGNATGDLPGSGGTRSRAVGAARPASAGHLLGGPVAQETAGRGGER